jgi:hypothetical protein
MDIILECNNIALVNIMDQSRTMSGCSSGIPKSDRFRCPPSLAMGFWARQCRIYAHMEDRVLAKYVQRKDLTLPDDPQDDLPRN